MARVYCRYTCTSTGARFMARTGGAGVMVLQIAGQTIVGDTLDTLVDDGTGVVVVSGLQPDTTYPWTLFVGADSVAGELLTDPAPGQRWTGRLAWGSCIKPQREMVAGYTAIALGIRAFFKIGDFIYADSSGTAFGQTFTSTNTAGLVTDTATYYGHYRRGLVDPGIRWLDEHVQTPEVEDDHIAGLDNFPHVARCIATTGESPATTFCGTASPWAPNDASFDAIWAAAYQGFKAYSKHNPRNLDAGQPASAMYFEKRMGHITALVLSCIGSDASWYRDYADATDDASKYMLSPTQEQWLYDRAAAAQADSSIEYVLVFSGKKLWKCTNDNGDTFDAYQTQRDRILTWFAENITKTVVFLAGDRHSHDVGDNGTYVCVCACPIGQPHNTDGQGSGYPTNIVYKLHGYPGTVLHQAQGFGVIDVLADAIEIWIRDTARGELCRLRFEPGSSRPVSRVALAL